VFYTENPTEFINRLVIHIAYEAGARLFIRLYQILSSNGLVAIQVDGDQSSTIELHADWRLLWIVVAINCNLSIFNADGLVQVDAGHIHFTVPLDGAKSVLDSEVRHVLQVPEVSVLLLFLQLLTTRKYLILRIG